MDKTTILNMLFEYIQVGNFKHFFILVQTLKNTDFLQTLTFDELYAIKEHLDFAIQNDLYAQSIYVDILKYDPNSLDLSGCYQVHLLLEKITLMPSFDFDTKIDPVIVGSNTYALVFCLLCMVLLLLGYGCWYNFLYIR